MAAHPTARLTVAPHDPWIDVAIETANGEKTQLRLSKRESLELLLALLKALNALPADSESPLHLRAPALKIQDPTFATSLREDGAVVLTFKDPQLPSLEFTLPKEAAADLAADLGTLATLPASTPTRN